MCVRTTDASQATPRISAVTGSGTFVGTWIVYPSTAALTYEGTFSYNASN